MPADPWAPIVWRDSHGYDYELTVAPLDGGEIRFDLRAVELDAAVCTNLPAPIAARAAERLRGAIEATAQR